MAEQEPTFNWNGNPSYQEGEKLFYTSFMFCNVRYSLGDFVYLLPEDEGAPLYIARLKAAYEDQTAVEGERLSIQVQWFERKDNSPEELRANMHDKEVLESDCCDNNLVGCIDRKIQVVKARNYEEALGCLSEAQRAGEWFFCRGRLSSQEGSFVGYTDAELSPPWLEPPPYLGEDPLDPYDRGHFAGGYLPEYGMRAGFGRGPRGPMPTFNLGPGRGIPGKVCAECGATTTPQWREGPAGPKSLCNACGVRYQRATKAKTGAKRPPAERRNSPPVRGPLPKQARSGQPGGGRGRGGGRGPGGYGGRGVGRPWVPPGQPLYSDEDGGPDPDGGEDGEAEGDLASGDRGRDASPPGRRAGEPLQRTKTQEAAELLSTFKMGAALAGPPPGNSPGGGCSGLAAGGPGNSDMLPLMSLDERGGQGTSSATGYGGHNGSPAHGMRGPLGHSRFAHDIPSPILAAAAAASGDMPPLHPEMPAPLSQQVLPLPDSMGNAGAPSGLRHLMAAGGPGTEGGPEADHALADAEHAAHNAHAAHCAGAPFDGAPRGLTDDDILKLWQRSTQFLGDSPPPAGLVGMMAVLPPHWHTRLADVKARAEVAANSANAAAAAVTAVAHVLEQKQRLQAETAAEAAVAFRQFQEVVTNAAKQFGGFKAGVGRVVRGPVGPDAPSSPGLSGAARLPPPGSEQLQQVGPLSSLLLERDTPPAVGAVVKEEPPAAAAAGTEVQQDGSLDMQQQQQVDAAELLDAAAGALASATSSEPSGNGAVPGAGTSLELAELGANLQQQQQPPAVAEQDSAAADLGGGGAAAEDGQGVSGHGGMQATKASHPAGVLLNNTVKCTSPPNGGTDSVDGEVAGASTAATASVDPPAAAEPPSAAPA